MKFRTLGSTGLRVSVIGIGTWQFGGEWGKAFSQGEVDRLFQRGRELGINLIDTAECYGDHTSEAFIGAAIKGQREDWVVATKFGHVFHDKFKRTDERSAADAQRQVEASLAALQTDYIDVLQFHSVRDQEFDDPALLATLQKLKQQGKVRYIGNSISPNTNIYQTQRSKEASVEVIQVVYNRLDQAAEKEVLPTCISQNLGVLARVPLASGYLSGKYKPGAKFAAGDVRSRHKPMDVDAKLRQVAEIAANEVPPGVLMPTWALAWCLRSGTVTSVIPGCKDIGQLEQNAAASELSN